MTIRLHGQLVLDKWYDVDCWEIVETMQRRMFPDGPYLGGPEPVPDKPMKYKDARRHKGKP